MFDYSFNYFYHRIYSPGPLIIVNLTVYAPDINILKEIKGDVKNQP